MTDAFDKITDDPPRRCADDLRQALKDWFAELRRLDAIVAAFETRRLARKSRKENLKGIGYGVKKS